MTRDFRNERSRNGDALSDQAIDLLVQLRSGHATPADRAAFDAWRATSDLHAAAAREAEAIWNGIADTAVASAHVGAAAATPAVAARQRPGCGRKSHHRRSRRILLGSAIAASLAIIVIASGLLDPFSRLYADHATAVGERREVRLPDGSTALLNSASAIGVDYGDGMRRLTLYAGEALFDVRKDSRRPFVVVASGAAVRAVGTAFSVRWDGEGARVVVAEGTVEIAASESGPAAATVSAGQRAGFEGGRLTEPPGEVDAENATAWTRGKLVFNTRPLAEVVAELDRYRTGRIVLANSRIGTLKVSGVFDLGAPDAALDTLEQTLRIEVFRLPLLTVIR